MSNKAKDCGCGQQIDCRVTDCRYHSSLNCCNAATVKVENEGARRKGETFCATFESRSSL